MPQLRIGIIGASRIAGSAIIVPARSFGGVTVAAIAARDADRARAFAAAHGVPRVHPTYAALFADPDIDLVYIGTPPSTHAALALQAVAAGKPALVEKPFTLSAAEARTVINAASVAAVPVFEAMHSLHHPLFERLDTILADPLLGPIRSIHAHFTTPIAEDRADFRWSPALGGGALMDIAVYPLAWCRRIAGEAFRMIEAKAGFRDGVDIELSANLRFDHGIEARIDAAMTGRHHAALDIVLANGRIQVDNPLVPQEGNCIRVSGICNFSESVTGPSTYSAQLAAVHAAITGTRAFPLPPEDPILSMTAIDRVRAALAAT